jgi:hypothetical protein
VDHARRAHHRQELHDEVARLGDACVLDKPFELEQLRELARELTAPH